MGSRQKRQFAATRSRFFAKMRPPCVFWANFGSRKKVCEVLCSRLKNGFWPSDQAIIGKIQYNLCKELPTSSNGMDMAPPDCSAMTHWALRQHATTQAASEIFLLPLYIVVYHHKLMFV